MEGQQNGWGWLTESGAHWRMNWLSRVFGEPQKNLSLSYLDFLHSLQKILPNSCLDNMSGWQRLEVSTFNMQKFHLFSLISAFCLLLFCDFLSPGTLILPFSENTPLPHKKGTVAQLYGVEDGILETNCFLNRF